MHNASTSSPSSSGTLNDLRSAIRRIPAAALPGVMVAAMLFGLAPGAINAMQAEPAVAFHAAPVEPATLALPVERSRCGGCGFVQSIRHMETSPGVASYEFTVRMNDGSLRTSHDTSVGTWIVGDRIILVGGPKAVTL